MANRRRQRLEILRLKREKQKEEEKRLPGEDTDSEDDKNLLEDGK